MVRKQVYHRVKYKVQDRVRCLIDDRDFDKVWFEIRIHVLNRVADSIWLQIEDQING